MIDLVVLETTAAKAGERKIEVTAAFLHQVIEEIAEGRAAKAALDRKGQCFGLPEGVTL